MLFVEISWLCSECSKYFRFIYMSACKKFKTVMASFKRPQIRPSLLRPGVVKRGLSFKTQIDMTDCFNGFLTRLPALMC